MGTSGELPAQKSCRACLGRALKPEGPAKAEAWGNRGYPPPRPLGTFAFCLQVPHHP